MEEKNDIRNAEHYMDMTPHRAINNMDKSGYKPKKREFRRGDVWYVRIPNYERNVIGIIVSNEKANRFSPNATVVLCRTTGNQNDKLPVHVTVEAEDSRMYVAKCEDIYTVSKANIEQKLTHIPHCEMGKIEKGLMIQTGIEIQEEKTEETEEETDITSYIAGKNTRFEDNIEIVMKDMTEIIKVLANGQLMLNERIRKLEKR